MNEQKFLRFNKENVYCAPSPKGYGLTHFAKKNFQCHTTVVKGLGKVIGYQTSRFSVQIGSDKHYIPQKWTGMYWNHSCEPNTFVRTRPDGFPDLIARREIQAHEEITYAYYMTEYEWSKDAEENWVPCQCGSKSCTGRIKSFSQLTDQEQLVLVRDKQISDYLVELVNKTIRQNKNKFVHVPFVNDLPFQAKEINIHTKQTVIRPSYLIWPYPC